MFFAGAAMSALAVLVVYLSHEAVRCLDQGGSSLAAGLTCNGRDGYRFVQSPLSSLSLIDLVYGFAMLAPVLAYALARCLPVWRVSGWLIAVVGATVMYAAMQVYVGLIDA